MKQTAVEWLVEQMKTWGDLPRWQRDEIIEQAKEMEKEQMRIYSIDKELFKRLPIEGTNFCSFNVKEFRYFATKYYIDNFKETFKSE
jgi:hypothetical protein